MAVSYRFIAALAALVACATFVQQSAASEQPRKGGTLVYAVQGDPPTIDCHGTSTFATMH